MTQSLRSLKHGAFLARKKMVNSLRPPLQTVTDLALTGLGRVQPYDFDARNYHGQFLASHTVAANVPEQAPPDIYMFWLGNTPISANRSRAIDAARELNPHQALHLVTEANLGEYLRSDLPLHSAYKNLALTHKSDYLRCYFMHVHGGGYLDVKTIHQSWSSSFSQLNALEDRWMLGYREIGHASTTPLPGAIQDDVRRNFFRIIGTCSFIAKPNSPLTSEWFGEITRRLNYYEDLLQLHPGGVRGGESYGEVVPKHALLADILGPLALKYHEKLVIDDRVKPDFVDYL
ncbi:capsular polysaccharide synthesis protein [Pseudoclavibacter terrae]|uniref:capsular polysaccharide synthesis protein n=1 Tax=Pseudoclavibacter terrae TaxID=1530195 RepID=UPI00142ECAA2|nr:capsular polysaccharide synthesis protein [Pseudoclavibacter terrae]